MPNKYFNLGGAKRLHEIVLVGSHDAGINQPGHGNVQTQTLDIAGQATAGVRFFDLRIAAAKSALGPQGKRVEMKAYHGDLKTKSKYREVEIGARNWQQKQVDRSTMKWEGWGLSLTSILRDARDFVLNNPTEFLLLKFDKCNNWELIAEAANAVLTNNTYYNAGGDLNTKALDELQGKVIVLFSHEGLQNIRFSLVPNMNNILPWQNLEKEPNPAYNRNLPGLKYFGGFGDSMLQPTTNKKMQKNLAKQVANMHASHGQDPRVLRMMYWTTTGLFQNIQDRNREMWQPPCLKNFLTAWDAGVAQTVRDHAPLLPTQGYADVQATGAMAAATQIHDYFPNIIMIDFADQSKCDLIYNLNLLTTTQVARGMSVIGQRAGA
jgi:hypothetical protein